MNTRNTDLVNEMALGWYSLDDQGNLLTNSKTGWHLKTEMVIHLPDRDLTFASLTAIEIALNNAISGIVEEARSYKGVNLDIEGLGWKEQGENLNTVRDGFSTKHC